MNHFALLLLSAFIATVAAAPTARTTPTIRQALATKCDHCGFTNFNLVNSHRSQNGKSTLAWNSHLADLAAGYSKQMFDSGVFAHSTLGYAENIAFASGRHTESDIAQGFFNQWRTSPGHNANMLHDSYRCIGVGIHGDGSKFYGTQLFSSDC